MTKIKQVTKFLDRYFEAFENIWWTGTWYEICATRIFLFVAMAAIMVVIGTTVLYTIMLLFIHIPFLLPFLAISLVAYGGYVSYKMMGTK